MRMPRLARRRVRKHGLPPGTLIHVGERKTETVQITVIDYDENGCREARCQTIAECEKFRQSQTTSWINVDGIHDVALMEEAGRLFGIHPLVLEDILHTGQRPKCEDYDDYLFLVVRMLTFDKDRSRIVSEQVSVILGPTYVLSFQEGPGDVFDPLRERLRTGKGRIRRMGSDYLAHCMLDAILDGYFVILEGIGERVEALEERLIREPDQELLGAIYQLRRECAYIRKWARPLREMIGSFERGESHLVRRETTVYLRDLYDHAIRIIDTMEILRDSVSGMLEMYLSSSSNRMNEVMKVLTLIATIFIPLTFLAGVYGMNFRHMPELDWSWSYPALWCVMILVAGGMIFHFWRKRWI